MRRSAAACLLFMLLANALMVSGVGGADGAGSGADGRGTSRATTLIHNVFELQNMSKDLYGAYELANDIDASGTRNWNNKTGFAPVGNYSSPFNGMMDGKGYNITGLYINRPGTGYIGLFGYIGNDSLVKNIGIVNDNVTGNYSVGGLVGNNGGTVNNSHATGNVTGLYYGAGGLVGVNNGTVSDSYAAGYVTGTIQSIGGLAGYNNHYCMISNSYATGNVAGTRDWVGGLLGVNSGTVINSHATGSVNGTYDEIGGLVGINYGTVSNSYAVGNVTGMNSVGGLVGHNTGGTVGGTVNNSYATGNVSATYLYAGGLVGENEGMVNNSYATGNATGPGSKVGGLVGMDKGVVANSHATGNVNGPWGVGGLVGEADICCTIFNSYSTGNVNGNSFVGGSIGSMVMALLDIVRMNMTYATGNVTGINYTGGLIGLGGRVNNSYATGNVTGTNYVGGLIGITYHWVSNSYSAGKVTGSGKYIGGFIGNNSSGSERNCFWDNETSGQNLSAGGTGKTTAEMMTRSTFTDAGWDFGNVWFMKENVTYPLFRDQVLKPHASAGPNQTIDEGTTVMFNGSGSYDYFGIVNYTWTFMDLVPVTIYGVLPSYRFLNPGVFVVTLKVTNIDGYWATDAMTVTVIDKTPPVADVGPDRTIDEGTSVVFDGSACRDNVGVVNYSWTFVDGSQVAFFGIRSTYLFDRPGIFVVTLNVTDAAGNRATDTMTVTVKDVRAPIADAGPDQTVEEGALVIFDGTGSRDTAGIFNYTWTFTDGVPIMLYSLQPTFRFDNPGIYFVTLNVSDSAGHRGIDTMTVTVIDITPPVADAGPDLTVDEGSILTFDGTGSIDNVAVVNLIWTFIDGGLVALYGPRPTSMFENPGTFVITLTATDAAGNTGKDTMTVTVNAVTAKDVIPPLAVAGPNQIVNEQTLVTFNGSGCSDNVGVVNYSWTFTDGAPVILYGAQPESRFNNPGSFIVTLNVTDAAGNWKTDTLIVKVRDITYPVANAGPDQTVDEKTSVMFNGNGSSDNVGIVNWTWTFEYGAKRIVLSGVSPLFFFEVPGVYSIRLNVTDAAGFWTEDTMVITVRDITPPVAAAGRDRTIPAGRTIVFDGSLSTDNVAISKCFWNFTYGGKAESLEGKNVSFKFDKPGVYEVVLTVMDAAGNRGQDQVVVTVEPSVNVDYASLAGLLWMAALLIAIAVFAGFIVLSKRKARKGGLMRKTGSKPGRQGRNPG